MKTGTVIDLFPGGVFGAGFALAALLAMTSCGVQTWRLDREQAKGATLKESIGKYANAQETNLGTIETLRDKLAVTVDQFRADRAAAARAEHQSTVTILRINAKNDRLRAELENVYARIPSARAWGAAPVDAAVLSRLPHGASGGDAHD